MKKMIVFAGLMIGITSCEKMDMFHKDKECPIVSRESLPSGLAPKFEAAYPNATSTVWFDQDGKNYVVVFINNGVETDVVYDRSGNFISQDVESADDSENGDNEDHGCDCDLETEDGE